MTTVGNSPGPQSGNRLDPYAALRIPAYRLFTVGRNISGMGDSMQAVAVGWELYARTHNSMSLAIVGLVQAAPILIFALFAGHVADRYRRIWVAAIGQLLFTLGSFLLAFLSLKQANINFYYICLFLSISARTFGNPARTALLPQIVPVHLLGNAISWDTSIRRIAVMAGNAVGGSLLAWSGALVILVGAGSKFHPVLGITGHSEKSFPAVVFLINGCLGLLSTILLLCLKIKDTPVTNKAPMTWDSLMAGIRYIRSTRIILATIALDLFAVLFGGATSLLPVYAKDILHIGPAGLGRLRAAPSGGALLMALYSAHSRPMRYPGRAMLGALVGFGVFTVIFGLSRVMWLSIASLAMIGALDMVSVVVRQTLIQTLTPNEMRGRVNAVNAIFINSSNEIGGFESGVVARIAGTVFSVVGGGIASIAVTVYARFKWPALTSYQRGDADETIKRYEETVSKTIIEPRIEQSTVDPEKENSSSNLEQ